MNDDDRKNIKGMMTQLDEISTKLEELSQDLQERADGMAEYFDGTEQHERLESEACVVEEAYNNVEFLKEELERLLEGDI